MLIRSIVIYMCIFIILATNVFAAGNVKLSSPLEFPDGTFQSTATVQGPVGLQGAQGDTGPQGPQGPPVQVTLDLICNAILLANKILPSFCINAVVSATSPVNTATAVKLNSKITATFNVAMDPATITPTTFTLKQGAIPVEGSVSYISGTAVFTPTTALVSNKSYTATITTGAKDLAGNTLVNAYIWSFTTEAFSPIIFSWPSNLDTNVSPATTLGVHFSEEMDPLTITSETFTLKAGTTPVSGTVVYFVSGEYKVANFAPSSDLLPNTLYTATITTGAKNLTGTALGSDYVWSFTTGTPVWKSSISGTTNELNAVVYGGVQFVAVGSLGTILTSPDGINWTTQTSGVSSNLKGITYANGQYLAVGSSGAVLTSPNGTSWTSRVSATSSQLTSVYYGSGIYVAVGNTGIIQTSPDGISWTLRTSGVTKNINGVTYGGNQFVAVGSYLDGIADSTTILTSPDGINWTARSANLSLPGVDLRGIVYDGQYFVAVTGSISLRSIDGINWTNTTINGGNCVLGIAYSGTKFVTVGCDSMSSPDGSNWTFGITGSSLWLNGVAYGAGTFVAVGYGGEIFTSL